MKNIHNLLELTKIILDCIYPELIKDASMIEEEARRIGYRISNEAAVAAFKLHRSIKGRNALSEWPI